MQESTTPDPGNDWFKPNTNSYIKHTVNLSSLQNKNSLLRIHVQPGTGGNALYIDDIELCEYAGIDEYIDNYSITISPNPAKTTASLKFDLAKPSKMKITLNDVSGKELFEIYDGFASEGWFNKDINVRNLSSGVYYIHIIIDNNVKVEPIVVE